MEIKEHYDPKEFTSGRGTKQDAMIQPSNTIKTMVSVFESSRRKYFFIIFNFNCL